MAGRIRDRLRTLVLVQVLLALAVAAALWVANMIIDQESAQVDQAHQIQHGVYELFLTTRSYLAHGEEGLRQQWEARFASLQSLVRETLASSQMQHPDLANISDSTRQMEDLFHQLVAVIAEQGGADDDDAAIRRDVLERLTTRLIGRGQVTMNHASQLTLESTTRMHQVRIVASIAVFLSALVALVASGLLHQLLERDIVSDIGHLRQGTEIVAAGNLNHRVGQLRTEELNGLAHAFNAMAARRQAVVKDREVLIGRLERSNRELEDFAFVASHDLQEPLRKIQTFGELVEQQGGDRLDASSRDYLARMRSAAGRMQALILALLQYSRIATKPEPPTLVALGPLVGDVLSDLSVALAQSRGSVSVDELPTVAARPVQMRQLFQNLLSNSLKFHSEAPPSIRVWAAPSPQGSWVEIRVEDNGIGFDEEYLPRLFQPFSRLHGRSEYEGTGMGLAICRRIVERHGGTITATSAPGRGSTFSVKLPREAEA